METQNKSKFKYRSALFDNRTSAESAYNAAISHGYRPEDINVIMSEETRKKYFGADTVKLETGDKSMEGLAIGGALGGTVLGVIGAILALSSTIVVPGLGLVVAGPLAAGLIGAGAGSIAGGFLGILIGAGLPEAHAKLYEKGIKEGGIVVAVNRQEANEGDDLLVNEWKKYNGRDIY